MGKPSPIFFCDLFLEPTATTEDDYLAAPLKKDFFLSPACRPSFLRFSRTLMPFGSMTSAFHFFCWTGSLAQNLKTSATIRGVKIRWFSGVLCPLRAWYPRLKAGRESLDFPNFADEDQEARNGQKSPFPQNLFLACFCFLTSDIAKPLSEGVLVLWGSHFASGRPLQISDFSTTPRLRFWQKGHVLL